MLSSITESFLDSYYLILSYLILSYPASAAIRPAMTASEVTALEDLLVLHVSGALVTWPHSHCPNRAIAAVGAACAAIGAG